VLHAGRTVLAGEVHQVYSQYEVLTAAGLGLPTAVEVVRALAQEGVPVSDRPVRAAEVEEALWQTLRS